jgi:hypothetical protein
VEDFKYGQQKMRELLGDYEVVGEKPEPEKRDYRDFENRAARRAREQREKHRVKQASKARA